MAQAKKFGTFAGVFTPSILSILGVIMYLRLGWVVGEVGLYNALAIILLAHVISVTTGLSISSIATDKKIQGGGIYYMLSRSLGLPMGGAIGIIIFIATSLAIALYLIGFAENFLSITPIREFLNLGNTTNDIRIVGTAAILFIVVIAFISTSLAIKSQYVVFAAIIISLVAIIVGLIMNVDIRPEVASLQPKPGALPFEAVFAIFFPAVTGFTVGVAMSGDLKDPKKSIPKGTMMAIGVGLVIYISLAVMFGLMVNRDVLLSDYNFLTNIALWAPLVVAGVWAATLSSGLGGILGAPRIMQRLALDRIMPRLLGKGAGVNNEPRNALILTFIIAQIAILIGELDIVARLATMFYIAAYGFINLSYTLESWANPDFRPSFKIPKWIGILGFLACFGIMFKMDAVVMILAIMAMFLVYLLLSRRKFTSDYGDVWQSVWSSVVRSSLNKIAFNKVDERQWQPNIILFSGGSTARPHLIEFGKQLIGSQGLLSNFDLIKIDDENKVLPRNMQVINDGDDQRIQGFFSRKHYCTDIYEGIKTITSVYGFSGIEPNSVMLGWARQSLEPEKFLHTINYVKALDLNILLMDYDKGAGFGKYAQIDIWWRTTEHNGNLGLLLLKFLRRSENWRNVRARILIVNPVNDQKHIIQQNTREILENLRIKAEVKIINNQIDQKSFYEIVQVESVNSDLILLGLPDIEEGNELNFVEETNQLCKDIGTVILMKASTAFKKLNIGIRNITFVNIESRPGISFDPALSSIPLPETYLSGKPQLTAQIRMLHHNLAIQIEMMNSQYIDVLFSYHASLLGQIEKVVDKHFENLNKKMDASEGDNVALAVAKFNTNLWLRFRRLLTDHSDEISVIQVNTLSESLKALRTEVDRIISESPLKVKIELNQDNLIIFPSDNIYERVFKLGNRLRLKWSSSENIQQDIAYQRIMSTYLESSLNRILYELLEKWGDTSAQFLMSVNKLFNDISTILIATEKMIASDVTGQEKIAARHEEIVKKIGHLDKKVQENKEALKSFMVLTTAEAIARFADEFKVVKSNSAYYRHLTTFDARRAIRRYLDSLPEKWLDNQKLLTNAILLDLSLISLNGKIKVLLNEAEHEIVESFDQHIIIRQNEIKSQLHDHLRKMKDNPDLEFNLKSIPELEHHLVVQALFNQLMQQTLNKIKQAARALPDKTDLMEPELLRGLHANQFKAVGSLTIYVSRLIEFVLQSEFVDSVQKSLSDVSGKLLPIKSATNEVIRSLDFRLNPDSAGREVESLTVDQKQAIITDHVQQLELEIEKATQLKNTLIKMFHERINTFEDKLTFFSFIDQSNYLREYIRQREISKGRRLLRQTRYSVTKFVQRQINQFWYRRSSGLLFTRKLRSHSQEPTFRVNETLNMLEDVSIKPDIIRELPFYYMQLFIRKQYYLNELWVGREIELAEAEKAVRRYRAGLKGAIMVTGDHYAGKTFFSQYFINKFYPDSHVHTLTPPYAGSIDPNLFKKTLESVFEISGSYYKIFNTLPENSVLIIDDLALWWEQSEQGFAVVSQLIELIDKYAHRCLFVVNLNKFTFSLLRRLHAVENYFISIIEIQPFIAEELQQVVLRRHESSNLKLRMHNRLREHIRSWDYAKLFSRYFTMSGGNVGVALQYWLANIGVVRDNTLYINTPHIWDTTVLGMLKPEWYLLIIQLLLHKRGNLRKLSRLLRENPQDIKETIDILLRAGIIEEKNPGVYELNVLLYPFILKKLSEKEMI